MILFPYLDNTFACVSNDFYSYEFYFSYKFFVSQFFLFFKFFWIASFLKCVPNCEMWCVNLNPVPYEQQSGKNFTWLFWLVTFHWLINRQIVNFLGRMAHFEKREGWFIKGRDKIPQGNYTSWPSRSNIWHSRFSRWLT